MVIELVCRSDSVSTSLESTIGRKYVYIEVNWMSSVTNLAQSISKKVKVGNVAIAVSLLDFIHHTYRSSIDQSGNVILNQYPSSVSDSFQTDDLHRFTISNESVLLQMFILSLYLLVIVLLDSSCFSCPLTNRSRLIFMNMDSINHIPR